MRIVRSTLAAAIAALIATSGCGRDEAGTPLAHVPADTPYVFANLEPVPKATIDAYGEAFAPFMKVYEELLGATAAKLESEHADEPASKVMRAILSDVKGQLNADGFRARGFDTDARFAFYGIGLVPVFRVELADEAKFRAFIGRVTAAAGEPSTEAKLGDASWWRVGPAGEKLMGLVAIHDGDVVAALAPVGADEKVLKALIGIDAPSAAIDASALESINDAGGYLPYGSGYVDTVELAERMLDPKALAAGIEGAFLGALGYPAETPPDAVCRAEMIGIAKNFPRATFGYTAFEPKRMEQRLTVELAPELAKDVMGFAAPVPGLGGANDGVLVDFGVSLDLAKVAAFATRQAQAVAATPYQCAELQALNASFKSADEQLSNPMVMASAPVISGFRAALTRFARKDALAVPEMSGKLVVASQNPQALVGLARTAMPQLAELKLAPGAAPVALPAALAPEGTPPTHVALAEKALGVAVGAGEEASLQQFITAAPGSPSPLFSVTYSGAFMSEMMALPGMTEDQAMMNDPEMAAIKANMDALRDLYGRVFDRFGATLVATERGLELRQDVRMK